MSLSVEPIVDGFVWIERWMTEWTVRDARREERGVMYARKFEGMRKVYREEQERVAMDRIRGFDSGINIPTSTQTPLSSQASHEASQGAPDIQSSLPTIQ